MQLVIAVAMSLFVWNHLTVCGNYILSWIRRPYGYSCLGHFMVELLQCTLPGVALEDHFAVIAGQECRGISGNGDTLVHSKTPLLHELHWLPLGFWVESIVAVIVYISLHDSGPV